MCNYILGFFRDSVGDILRMAVALLAFHTFRMIKAWVVACKAITDATAGGGNSISTQTRCFTSLMNQAARRLYACFDLYPGLFFEVGN